MKKKHQNDPMTDVILETIAEVTAPLRLRISELEALNAAAEKAKVEAEQKVTELKRIYAEDNTEKATLRTRAETAEEQLRIIGDMAVSDWDAKTVGAVDAALKDSPFDQRKYAERVRSLFERARRTETAEATVKDLQGALEIANRSADDQMHQKRDAEAQLVIEKHSTEAARDKLKEVTESYRDALAELKLARTQSSHAEELAKALEEIFSYKTADHDMIVDEEFLAPHRAVVARYRSAQKENTL